MGILNWILSNTTDLTELGGLDITGLTVTHRDGLLVQFSVMVDAPEELPIQWGTSIQVVENLPIEFEVSTFVTESLEVQFAIDSIAAYTSLEVSWQYIGGGYNYGFIPPCTTGSSKASCKPSRAYTTNCFKC